MVKLPSGTCVELRRCGEVMSLLRKGEVEIKSGVWSLSRVFPSSGTVNKNKIKKASKSRLPRHRSRSDGRSAKLALICFVIVIVCVRMWITQLQCLFMALAH